MSGYDGRVPASLVEVQEWFGPLISRPLDEHGGMKRVSLRGVDLEEEALEYITSSPTLLSHERVELYNQQYWWRLVKNMKFAFPCVWRLFGEGAFEQEIVVPYLTAYPPRHWSIDETGLLLTRWVKEAYTAPDKELVWLAADIDWLCCSLFTVGQGPGVSETELMEQPVALQPYVGLRAFKNDFMTFRGQLLQESVKYWGEHPFPVCEKRVCFYAVMRDVRGDIQWRELSRGEYSFLSLLQEKGFLGEVCELLEEEEDLLEEVQAHLMTWIQYWFPHLTPKVV